MYCILCHISSYEGWINQIKTKYGLSGLLFPSGGKLCERLLAMSAENEVVLHNNETKCIITN